MEKTPQSAFLIDSDVLINHLRGRASLKAYLGDLQPLVRYGCSTIVVAEVYAGMRLEEEAVTRQLIESLVHFPVTTPVAEEAARLKKENAHSGKTLALDDCLIAATALLERATLVTCNAKHYPMVSDKISSPISHS